MNYKKLVDEQLKRFEKDVNAYFLKLFNDIKPEKNVDFITCEQLTEVLGGEEAVQDDKRLEDLLWQSRLILDNKIKIKDFSYVL